MGLPLGRYGQYQPGDDPQWEYEFALAHDGMMPWEDPNTGEATVSALLNQLNARAFGEGYQSMYGAPPSMDAYRANWFGVRGLGQAAPRAMKAVQKYGWTPLQIVR